jgi:hypothetical protein
MSLNRDEKVKDRAARKLNTPPGALTDISKTRSHGIGTSGCMHRGRARCFPLSS